MCSACCRSSYYSFVRFCIFSFTEGMEEKEAGTVITESRRTAPEVNSDDVRVARLRSLAFSDP